jgi:hypothetical protein
MTRYEAPLDHLGKILTTVVFIIVLIPLVKIILAGLNGHPEMWLILAVLLIALGVSMLYRPLYYTLDESGLHIHRKKGVVTVSYGDIETARSITKKELGFGIRLFGTSGFFGYFGKFLYRKLGTASVYVTDTSLLVLIQTARKNILISPAPQADFLKELNRALQP